MLDRIRRTAFVVESLARECRRCHRALLERARALLCVLLGGDVHVSVAMFVSLLAEDTGKWRRHVLQSGDCSL